MDQDAERPMHRVDTYEGITIDSATAGGGTCRAKARRYKVHNPLFAYSFPNRENERSMVNESVARAIST